MKFRTTTLVMKATLLCLTPLGLASGTQPASASHPTPQPSAAPLGDERVFRVGPPPRTFESVSARGSYLVVHFLLTTECPRCLGVVHDTTQAAPTLAGVRHVFVKNDTPTAFDAFAAALPAPARDLLYCDEDGKLAEAFAIPDGYKFHGMTMRYPATVVLDPGGREVFRHVGKHNEDRLPFGHIASYISRVSADRSTDASNVSGRLALGGYDPVAYLAESRAVEGKRELESAYKGLTYRFASPASRARFNAEPDRFVPAYGGWCATAMAEGRKVDVDPRNFKVTDGRLFLFYKGWRGDAKPPWVKDEPKLTRDADVHWLKLTGKEPEEE